MIGSESPVEQLNTDHMPTDHESNAVDITHRDSSNIVLIHNTRPSALDPDKILLIHSNKDRVISALQITQLAEMWEIPQQNVRILETHSTAETLDLERRQYTEWCDDVQHDFIAKELLPTVLDLVSSFVV